MDGPSSEIHLRERQKLTSSLSSGTRWGGYSLVCTVCQSNVGCWLPPCPCRCPAPRPWPTPVALTPVPSMISMGNELAMQTVVKKSPAIAVPEPSLRRTPLLSEHGGPRGQS